MDLSNYKSDPEDWSWFSRFIEERGSDYVKNFHDKVFEKLSSMPVKSALFIPEICKEKNLELFIKMAEWYIRDHKSDTFGFFFNKAYTIIFKYTR